MTGILGAVFPAAGIPRRALMRTKGDGHADLLTVQVNRATMTITMPRVLDAVLITALVSGADGDPALTRAEVDPGHRLPVIGAQMRSGMPVVARARVRALATRFRAGLPLHHDDIPFVEGGLGGGRAPNALMRPRVSFVLTADVSARLIGSSRTASPTAIALSPHDPPYRLPNE